MRMHHNCTTEPTEAPAYAQCVCTLLLTLVVLSPHKLLCAARVPAVHQAPAADTGSSILPAKLRLKRTRAEPEADEA
jgi:hypothetical protein